MTTDSIQYLSIENKISSLERIIVSQQSKIDSLSQIVHDTQISEGHFSSIISIQTTIFSLLISVIIAFISFLTWKAIERKIRKSEKRISKKIHEIENDRIKERERFQFMEYKANSWYAYISMTMNKYFYSIAWALAACTTRYAKGDVTVINKELSSYLPYLSKIKREDISENEFAHIKSRINTLNNLDGVDKSALGKISTELNKLYYSES